MSWSLSDPGELVEPLLADGPGADPILPGGAPTGPTLATGPGGAMGDGTRGETGVPETHNY